MNIEMFYIQYNNFLKRGFILMKYLGTNRRSFIYLAFVHHYDHILILVFSLNIQNRPSLKARPPNKRKKIGFSPSQQHAKNTDMMMQCDECNKWRLIFSKKKLTKKHKDSLNEILANIAYTCGFMFGKSFDIAKT